MKSLLTIIMTGAATTLGCCFGQGRLVPSFSGSRGRGGQRGGINQAADGREVSLGRGAMWRLQRVVLGFGACAMAVLGAAGDGAAQQKEIVVGQMCDRTGPTQINGVVLCPAGHDYYDLINSKGGVEGYRIKATEIDHEYKVPQAVEAYQRLKGEGAPMRATLD